MESKASWWRQRRHFLRRSLVKGFDPYNRLFALLATFFNFGVLAVLGWGLHRLRLGIEIVVLVLALIFLEGAFRLLRVEETESERLGDALDDHLRPRLCVTPQGDHFNVFADGTGSGKYSTVKVSATEPVRRCRAHITSIETEGTDVPVRSPIPLRWIGKAELEIDLAPGLDHELTVVFTESTRPGDVMIATDSHEPRGIPWALAHGVSVISVVVSAEGVPAAAAMLRVHADADWTKLQTDPVGVPPRPIDQHPLSTWRRVVTGATGPYDDGREAALRRQIPTGPGTAAYTSHVIESDFAPTPPSASEGRSFRDDDRQEAIGLAQRVLGELTNVSAKLERADSEQWYWNPPYDSLKRDEWDRSRERFSTERELRSSYQTVNTAYDEIDRINSLVVARYSETRADLTSPGDRKVNAFDRLHSAIARVEDAIDSLTEKLDEL